jgi:hypothetical protein
MQRHMLVITSWDLSSCFDILNDVSPSSSLVNISSQWMINTLYYKWQTFENGK